MLWKETGNSTTLRLPGRSSVNAGGGRGGAAHARRCVTADASGCLLAASLPPSPVRWPTGARRWGWMKVLRAGGNSLISFPVPAVQALPLRGVPVQPPSHRRPDWSRRVGFLVPRSTQGRAIGLGKPGSRLGPTSDRALDFYRAPPVARGIRVGSREAGG